MSSEIENPQARSDPDFRTYLTAQSPSLFRTPSEIYALPVGTVLAAGRFGKTPSYYCVYSENLGMMLVCLDMPRQIPVKDELVIKWRGTPKSIEYQASFNHRKVAFDPDVEVTVLGFSHRGETHRHSDGHWALIDHI